MELQPSEDVLEAVWVGVLVVVWQEGAGANIKAYGSRIT